MRKIFVLFLFLHCIYIQSQILDISPAFPTVNDVVTIVYNSNLGNGALSGVNTVYAHTGVTTSTSPNSWQYVKGNWGTADPNVLMSNLGGGLHSITIDIDQFYGFPVNTPVNQLAFVFRNSTGTIVGREADGSDIFYPVYPVNAGLLCKIFSPAPNKILDPGDSIIVKGKSNEFCSLELYDNGVLVANQNNINNLQQTIFPTTPGNHTLKLIANNGNQIISDSTIYIVNPPINILNPPQQYNNGLTIVNDSTIFLQLYAPYKNHIYVLGDFNNFTASAPYHMNLSTDSATWWIQISGLSSGSKLGYQYLIDGNLKIADPMSTLIADPANDNSISSVIYPDKYIYPTGKTTGFVSIFELGKTPYNWQNTNFSKPEKKNLIIYELLVRDFISTHSYQTLTDTLDYLAKLGINAIELMPVSEFENNESWGYNPSFHMALDKYYGTPDHLKTFIDSCHGRGIAVILDVVYNHAFGQNPMVNMYWNSTLSQPSSQNPWFNATCPHPPNCWGYDLNHASAATKKYIDQLNRYWLSEFKVDGFRFDFTKGFVNSTNGYDINRINNIKRMADSLWVQDSTAYIILEHWCDNNEEIVLSDYGMMLWGNVIAPAHEALKANGGNTNLSSSVFSNRNWNYPHLITYKESHDEQRSMYECLNYGNSSNPAHNVKSLNVALQRCQAGAAIQLLTPGPKMLWQFEELGYDIDINFPCRVCNKPILWNYYQQFSRKELYKVYRSVLNLRKNEPVFQTLNFDYTLVGDVKRIRFNETFEKAIVIANFDNYATNAYPVFQQTGTWYEYLSGDSMIVADVMQTINLQPGEYKIYTTAKHTAPETVSPIGYEELDHEELSLQLFPVPANDVLHCSFNTDKYGKAEFMVLDFEGKIVSCKNDNIVAGKNDVLIETENLLSGNYHLLIKSDSRYLGNKAFSIIK